MSNWPGNLIRKTPVTPAGPLQNGAAPGVWSLAEASYWTKQGLWPTQGVSGAFIGLLGGSGANTGRSVAIDSSGNIYVVGSSSASGTSDYQIAKYNNSGAIQWQRRLGGGGSDTGMSVAVDSSGNAYVCGFSNSAVGNNDFQFAKYDTSGSIQWQRSLSGGVDVGQGVAVDSSGNVYVCGYSNASGIYDLQLAKYDTSGTIQWQRRLGGVGQETTGFSVAVDGSGNVYVSGYHINSSSQWRWQFAKYENSGALSWQRELDGAGVDVADSIAVDSSGNVYLCGRNSVTGSNAIQLAKYNTSGAIQWQRSLTPASGVALGTSVAVDSSGNVYICGYSTDSGTADFQMAKYNTSGAIQWQRRLGSSSDDQGRSIVVDSSGSNFYVCGYSVVSGNNSFLIAKLPGDGSLTGTYTVGGVSFTYAATTLTDAATSLTSSTSSLTPAISSLTDAATSLTDTASTLTSTVTTL